MSVFTLSPLFLQQQRGARNVHLGGRGRSSQMPRASDAYTDDFDIDDRAGT